MEPASQVFRRTEAARGAGPRKQLRLGRGSWARKVFSSESKCFYSEMHRSLLLSLTQKRRPRRSWSGPEGLPGFLFVLGGGGELLQQRVGLALRRFHTVRPHDAGGPVEVQHHHQLLPFLPKLLDLGLQLGVDRLQTLRLLEGEEGRLLEGGAPPSCCPRATGLTL